MARLGEFLELDRISLFQFSADRAEISQIVSWKQDDAMPAAAALNAQDLPWWTEQMLRGHVSLMCDVDMLPPEAVHEQEYFRQRGVLSAASIPLSISGQVNGGISFVSTKRHISWKPDLVSQLQVIGEILWNAVQRKRAVAMLRESEERFRLVANTAPVMIWMFGEDRLCNYVNAPWLEFTGRSLDQELGDGWTESVHSEDLQHCLAAYTKAFDQRTTFQVEYRLKRHDGEYRWVFNHGVPRFNADGSFTGYIGSCTDVTERKKAEESLSGVSRRLIEAQEQERTWIARELHDDINQRIALLSASFGLFIQSVRRLDAPAKEKAEELRASVIAIGSDIQALSHHLHSSKLEYLGLVSACSSFCREMASRENVEIQFQSDEIPKSLPQDIGLCLFRVLQEALRNAVKHSRVTKFRVTVKDLPCCIELRVQDSGVGFDPQSAINSHGLGLISMSERLKLVDGQLFIESKPQGGTTLYARVPVALRSKSASAS
jgi:PAS domain S-box-containing protein